MGGARGPNPHPTPEGRPHTFDSSLSFPPMPSTTICLLCDHPNVQHQRERGDTQLYDCATCMRFLLSGTIELYLKPAAPLYKDRHVLSGLARRAYDLNQGPPLFTTATAPELIARAPVPRSPLDVIDQVLMDVITSVPSFGADAWMPQNDFPKYFLRSIGELEAVLQILGEEGLIALKGIVNARHQLLPLPKGWRRAQELREHEVKSDQAFVAMRFSDALAPMYAEGIEPALRKAGYMPLRVDRVPHNGTIDDRIIAEIRRSSFVVADLTENVNGVYFEAGFALGRSLDVIWMCHTDHLDHAHFDVKQYNMIVWREPADVAEKLYERVRATMPIRQPLPDPATMA
jgi:hypothetical protein